MKDANHRSKICQPHVCKCKKQADALGHHLLSCKFSEGRHPRHSALNDIICRALKTSGIPSVLEPLGLDRGDGKRPDGITIFPYRNGKSLCWDATCINTFAESSLNRSAIEAGTMAREAEDGKRRKYPALVDQYIFEPIAIETSGVMGPSTIKIINEIGRRLSERTGDKRMTLWLKQRLLIAVQRGNAVAMSTAAGEAF